MTEITRATQLNENQTYVARVRAINGFGVVSAWSDALVFNTGTGGGSGSLNRPTGLSVVAGIRSLILTWTANTESTFSHYEIYVSNTAFGGSVSAGYKYGDFFGTIATLNRYYNGASWQDMVPGTQYFVAMRAVDILGNVSSVSFDVSATTGFVGNTDLVVNTISGDKVVTNSLIADKISTGNLNAAIALLGSIKTATSGARVEIDSTGLRGYDNSGATPNFDYRTSDGSVTIRGDITASGYFGDGINLNSAYNYSYSTAADTATEKVPNGTFDTNATGWSANSGCTIARVTTPTQAGAGSLEISSTSAGTDDFSTPSGVSGIPITYDTVYNLSFYRRAAVTIRSWSVWIQCYDVNGNAVGSEFLEILGNDTVGSWTAATLQFSPATPSAVYMRLRFTISSSASSEIHYLDSVSIKEAVLNVVKTYSGASLGIWPSTWNTVSRDTVTYNSSPASLRFTFGSVGEIGEVYHTTYVPVKYRRAYKISFWARCDSGSTIFVWPRTEFLDSDGGTRLTFIQPDLGIALTTAWKQYTHVIETTVAPSNVAYIHTGLQLGDPPGVISRSIYIDDVVIENIPLSSGGYINADFVKSNTDFFDGTGYVLPTGSITAWAGSITAGGVWALDGESLTGEEGGEFITGVPTGWIPCDGRAVNRTTWRRLFAVLGTTYGSGDGSTTFNVPDLRGRVAVCLDDMGGSDAGRLSVANTLGGTGGTQTHTLSEGEMPSHTHTGPSHNHTPNAIASFLVDGPTSLIVLGVGDHGGGTYSPGVVSDTSSQGTGNTGSKGSGSAHNIMQPYILMNYLIKG